MHLWKEAPLTSEAAHGEPAAVQEKQASKKKLQEETMTPWATQETYGGNTGVGARRQGEVSDLELGLGRSKDWCLP